jgi:hypothetical protein
MREKYRGLVVASMVFKVAAVVVAVLGIGISLLSLISVDGSFWGVVVVVFGICGSLLAGLLIYSFGEVITLWLDIGTEIRDKNRGKEGEKVIIN